MALREWYQTEIEVDTLYEVRTSGRGAEQITPNIDTIGGTVNIYMSQVEPVTAPTGMSIVENGAAFVGNADFKYVMNYMYVEQDTGTTTSVVLSGINAEEVV